MLLYVIRHAEPTYSPDELTPLGKRQAEALARRLCVHGIDEIYTSPLVRARQTAEPLCELLHKQATVLDWTSEQHAFDQLSVPDPTHEGWRKWAIYAPRTEFRTEETLALGDKWYEAPQLKGSRAKECWERIGRESDAFLASHGYRHEGLLYRVTEPNDRRIAVFCHHGFGTTWLAYLFGISPILFWTSFDIAQSSVTVIRFIPEQNGCCLPGCLMMSDLSHIYESRLPLKYSGGLDL